MHGLLSDYSSKLKGLVMLNRKYTVTIVVIATVATLGFSWQFVDGAKAAKPGALFLPENAEIVATGKVIYRDNCAACHGEDLAGEPNWRSPGEDGKMPAPPHGKRGHTWHHRDQLLFGLTKFGAKKLMKLQGYETNMPIYDGVLSDEEIISVLSYIKSTWPDNIRQRHDAMNAEYAEDRKSK
jgi:mono/diheme cytochrome c family protein